MPFPNIDDLTDFQNRLIVDELSYDKSEMEKLHAECLSKLTDEQRAVYDRIMEAVLSGKGGFFSCMDMEAPVKRSYGRQFRQAYAQKVTLS